MGSEMCIRDRYRNALKNIKNSFKSDPLVAKSVAKNVMNSLDFYLELTNAFHDSFLDIFKKKSIFLIYSYIFIVIKFNSFRSDSDA